MDESLFTSKRIVFNVSGVRFEVRRSMLSRLPSSRLGQIACAKQLDTIKSLCDGLINNEVYFDTSSLVFHGIVNYYQTNKLHMIKNVCVLAFGEELNYWGLENVQFEKCCHYKYLVAREFKLKDKSILQNIIAKNAIIPSSSSCLEAFKIKVWNIMEKSKVKTRSNIFQYILYIVIC